MEEEIMEEMFNGFCKTLNETRTVICEFVKKDGKLVLDNADCAYGRCEHSKTCILMKPVREMGE